MIRIYVSYLLTIQSLTGFTQNFSETIYEIGPEKMECHQSYGECDCCTSSLFFIDETTFALMDYCTYDYILTTGNYKVQNSQLTLDFKPKSVISGQDVTIEDSEPYLEKQEVEIKPIEFLIGRCENGATMFQNNKFTNYKYGLRRNKGEGEAFLDLLNSKEWKLLNE